MWLSLHHNLYKKTHYLHLKSWTLSYKQLISIAITMYIRDRGMQTYDWLEDIRLIFIRRGPGLPFYHHQFDTSSSLWLHHHHHDYLIITLTIISWPLLYEPTSSSSILCLAATRISSLSFSLLSISWFLSCNISLAPSNSCLRATSIRWYCSSQEWFSFTTCWWNSINMIIIEPAESIFHPMQPSNTHTKCKLLKLVINKGVRQWCGKINLRCYGYSHN